MELLNLDGVIEKGVFEIPSYQRGYAWQERQLKDFWNDLEHVSKLGDKFHYMHSLTLRESENEFESSAFEIIDGQQRLATSLILLGLLAKITQNKDPKYSLINLEPILSYKHYGLSEAFRAIMGEEKDLEAFKTSFYAKNLISAYEFFKEKTSNITNPTLNKLLDALTKKMLFSVVELNDDRIDPFSSFETINNRGKDLSTLELFKNRLHFVAHKICDEKEELENLQKKINDTYAIIYYDLRQFKDTHLDSFLKHFVAYYYGESGKKFKERLLETEFDAYKKYDAYPYDEYEKINELLFYVSCSSKVWYFLHTLDDEELRIEITPKMRNLLDKIRRLNALSDNAFLPPLLSLLTIQLAVRSGSERHYTTKELEDLLEYLERFGFLIYGVAGSKNTAKKEWIGLAFKAIQACRFWEDKITIEYLPKLEKHFFNRHKNSALELLEESIHSKKNTEKWYQWGKALNYLLYEYELYHNPETTLNFDSSLESIEHILPQNPDQGYSAKEKNWAKNPHIVHALGNLLLIPKNANSSLSNKPFEKKRKEYLKGSYSEKEVAKNASFGIVEIQKRSEKLLDFLIARYRIAEINNKVVEAKVINIGFNRVTLRSQKGNEASYAFNSEKFLKWFKEVSLNEVANNHAEKSGEDLLKGLKVVTSGPSVKERTTTAKEKESKFKLDFDFADENEGNFLTIAELYANEKRGSRLGVLFVPMSYNGGGFQASLIILHALSYASSFKYHTDLEFNAMIESRDPENCMFDSFDNMGMGDVFTFCKAMEIYALNAKNGDKNGITLEEWEWLLPKNQKEAKFVAQLLCDGGINKYDLTCAGLTENLLKDNRWSYGMRDEFYDDEGNVIAEGDEATALKLKNENEGEVE